MRLKGRSGATWAQSKVEAAGPAVEPAPAYQGLDATIASRGVPLRNSQYRTVLISNGLRSGFNDRMRAAILSHERGK